MTTHSTLLFRSLIDWGHWHSACFDWYAASGSCEAKLDLPHFLFQIMSPREINVVCIYVLGPAVVFAKTDPLKAQRSGFTWSCHDFVKTCCSCKHFLTLSLDLSCICSIDLICCRFESHFTLIWFHLHLLVSGGLLKTSAAFKIDVSPTTDASLVFRWQHEVLLLLTELNIARAHFLFVEYKQNATV